MARDFDRETVLAAIEGSGGIVLAIASRLGCAWHTAKSYVTKWESTRRAFEDESEKVLDRAESLIRRNIDLGLKHQQDYGEIVDSGDAKWLLSRKGKARGYADKSEVEVAGAGGGAIVINDNYTDEQRVRGLVSLFDAIRSRVPADDNGGQEPMDAAERTAMGGDPQSG